MNLKTPSFLDKLRKAIMFLLFIEKNPRHKVAHDTVTLQEKCTISLTPNVFDLSVGQGQLITVKIMSIETGETEIAWDFDVSF